MSIFKKIKPDSEFIDLITKILKDVNKTFGEDRTIFKINNSKDLDMATTASIFIKQDGSGSIEPKVMSILKKNGLKQSAKNSSFIYTIH